MKIWIDAQLPPTLANWLSATFGLEAAALRDLSLRDAQDIEIFEVLISGIWIGSKRHIDEVLKKSILGTHLTKSALEYA